MGTTQLEPEDRGSVSSTQTQGNVTHTQSVPQNIHKKTSPPKPIMQRQQNVSSGNGASHGHAKEDKSTDAKSDDDAPLEELVKKSDETLVQQDKSASLATESPIISDTKSQSLFTIF